MSIALNVTELRSKVHFERGEAPGTVVVAPGLVKTLFSAAAGRILPVGELGAVSSMSPGIVYRALIGLAFSQHPSAVTALPRLWEEAGLTVLRASANSTTGELQVDCECRSPLALTPAQPLFLLSFEAPQQQLPQNDLLERLQVLEGAVSDLAALISHRGNLPAWPAPRPEKFQVPQPAPFSMTTSPGEPRSSNPLGAVLETPQNSLKVKEHRAAAAPSAAVAAVEAAKLAQFMSAQDTKGRVVEAPVEAPVAPRSVRQLEL